MERSRFLPVFCGLVMLGAVLVGGGRASGQVSAAQEWVDIPVIVNVIDNSDDSNFEEHLKKANDILKQAKIRLIVKKTNKPVNVGDGDGDLTEAEGNTAMGDGETELKDTFKGKDGEWTGKGIKITIADDCWSEEPGTIGWSIHRRPVVVVETGHSTESTGGTIAHELIHALTVTDHSDDPNNLMYATDQGQTYIDPNTIGEIFPEAKKRGNGYFVVPSILPSGSVLVPGGIVWDITAQGAVMDDFLDIECGDVGGCPGFDPLDPIFGYADIREVQIFASELGPGGTARLDVRFAGPPPELPSDFFISAGFDTDPDQPGTEMGLQAFGVYGDPASFQAELFDSSGETMIPLPPPVVAINDRFDGSGGPIADNHSIHLEIPTELIGLDLTSAGPVEVTLATDSFFSLGSPEQFFIRDVPQSFHIRITPLNDPPQELGLIPGGVVGWGFVPGSPVGVSVNDQVIGEALPNSDGEFLFQGLPPTLGPGVHSVIVKDFDDSGPGGAAYGTAFFEIPGAAPLAADLNGDGCVNLLDMAILLESWLNCETVGTM